MQSTDDSALLREYAGNNSGAAFAVLVARYVDLVYSVALRQVGNPHHAEEITQAVFIILARKAGELRHDKALSSWLFQTTRLTTNNFWRSEMRRQQREQEAFMRSTLNEPGNEVWVDIAPLLDAAVAGLNEQDRRTILLRFYEGRNLHEVGAALGASDEAARKRVNRAVEKLRRFFTKRGVVLPAAALTAVISAHSVQAAPIALANTVTAVAITKGATASASTLTLIKGALKIMAWTKAKTAIIVGAAVLVVVGITATKSMLTQVPTNGAPAFEVDRFLNSTTYPTVALTLAWDGTRVSYPDTAAILPALRQTSAYRAWRHDDHVFAGTNSAGYRFDAHFLGMAMLDGKPKEIIQDVRILRPDDSLLAYTAGPEEERWDVKIYDETGTNVTTRLQWERTAQNPNGFVSRIVHDPGTPKELMWFVNRFGVVYSDALNHSVTKYRDAPYP